MFSKRMLGILLAVTLLIWILWLPTATSDNFRFDSERLRHHSQEALTQYVSEGRSGLVLLLHLFGLTNWNPQLSGVLFLLFFTLSGLLICYFMQKFCCRINEMAMGLFLLLYGTSPIWAYHVYFVLQIAPLGLGMLLAVLLAGMDTQWLILSRPKPLMYGACFAGSTLVLAFVLSIYQGLIVYYTTVVVMFLFITLISGHTFKTKPFLCWMLHVLAALILYLVVSSHIQGEKSQYLAQQIQWGQIPFVQCLMNIVLQAGKMLLNVNSASCSLYPLAAVLLVILVYRQYKGEKGLSARKVWLLLTGLALLMLPMAMSILQGSRPVPRTQFALPLVAAFIPVCYLIFNGKKQLIVRIICLAAVVVQVLLNVRLLHTDNLRNAHDEQAAGCISAELQRMDTSKPLLFMGALSFQGEGVLTEKTDVYGRSFFEWIYDENTPGSATPSAVRLLKAYDGKDYKACNSQQLILEAAELAQGLPAYPQPGFVHEAEEYILIKLSQ